MDQPSRGSGRGPTVPADPELIEAFADSRRQHAIRILRQRGRTTLRELAGAVVRREGGDPSDETELERASLALYHAHLPKLAAAAVVEFDPDERWVRYTATAEVESAVASLLAV